MTAGVLIGYVLVPLFGVVVQVGHQGGGDRLPADGLAFLSQQDQALDGVEVLGA